jgi:hypothetical protein
MLGLLVAATQCIGLDASKPWVKRVLFSVGLGCPSFGGQRTDRGDSIRLLAGLVMSLKPSLPARSSHAWLGLKQLGSCKLQRLSSLWSYLLGQDCHPQSADGRNFNAWSALTEQQMLEVSTRQRCASVPSSHPFSAVPALRSCRLLAQSGLPNWSVKGTSRKRAAPYVER